MSLETEAETESESVWWYPADLAVVSLAAVVGYVGATALATGHAGRLAVSIPLLFFLPGYALVALLFPGRARPIRERGTVRDRNRPGGIDTAERLGLAIGISIAVVSIMALALPAAGAALSPESAAGVLAVVTIAAAQVAVVRRLRTPERDRYTVSVRRFFGRLARTDDGTSTATVSSIGLFLAIVVAGAVVVVALASPLSAAQYTELGLYTEDEDGRYVDANLPETIEPGEAVPVSVGVENREGQEQTYTVVVQEQRFDGDEVAERTELRRIDYRIGDGGKAYGDREVTPTADSGRVRIAFLLYRTDDGDGGAVPAEPTVDNADDAVYFWTEVVDTSTDAAAGGGPGGTAGGGGDADLGGFDDADDDAADDTDDDDGFPFDFDGIFEDDD